MDEKIIKLEQMYLQMLFDKNNTILQYIQDIESKDQIIKNLQNELSVLKDQNNVQPNV